MRKFTAFIVALVLFGCTVGGLHFYSIEAMALDNNEFSTWSNTAKFNSPDAIKANINSKTLVVFGSSEFQHGQKTIYHPKAVFKDFEFNPMLIGAGYYQCLEHAITLASIGDNIQNKKVVLLLSPTWFKKKGVVDTAFASRFSESSYLGMLQNQNITEETKSYIQGRTNKLLNVDKTTLKRVKIYDKAATMEKIPIEDDLTYKVYKRFLTEREHQGVIIQAKLAKIKANQNVGKQDKEINWEDYIAKAEEQGENGKQNPFYMTATGFAKLQYELGDKKIADKADKAKKNIKDCYVNSPEYGDFKCFLDICNELNIEPLIVALPVNGYWYEHVGLPAETRTNYYNNVKDIADEYGAELLDLSGEEFTKYFFEDSIHLAGKGWVSVDEAIYNFYNQDKQQSDW